MKKRFYVYRSTDALLGHSTIRVDLFFRNGRYVQSFCYRTWKRITGIELKLGQRKHIEIEIKEVK